MSRPRYYLFMLRKDIVPSQHTEKSLQQAFQSGLASVSTLFASKTKRKWEEMLFSNQTQIVQDWRAKHRTESKTCACTGCRGSRSKGAAHNMGTPLNKSVRCAWRRTHFKEMAQFGLDHKTVQGSSKAFSGPMRPRQRHVLDIALCRARKINKECRAVDLSQRPRSSWKQGMRNRKPR